MKPIALLLLAGAACTPRWTPEDTARAAADVAAQDRCILEAGPPSDPTSHARAIKCRCAVMARYPEGPQCTADGGEP